MTMAAQSKRPGHLHRIGRGVTRRLGDWSSCWKCGRQLHSIDLGVKRAAAVAFNIIGVLILWTSLRFVILDF